MVHGGHCSDELRNSSSLHVSPQYHVSADLCAVGSTLWHLWQGLRFNKFWPRIGSPEKSLRSCVLKLESWDDYDMRYFAKKLVLCGLNPVFQKYDRGLSCVQLSPHDRPSVGWSIYIVKIMPANFQKFRAGKMGLIHDIGEKQVRTRSSLIS